MSGPQVLGLVGGAAILVLLFELLRRERLRERHALVWSVLAVGAVLVGFFPGLLSGATKLLHLSVPSNLLFFIATLVLLGLSLQHSIELSRSEDKLRALAEELALLRLELEKPEEKPHD